MKVGLLARADDRGIASQTHEFYKHLNPSRTLVMMLHDPAWPENPARYNGRGVDYVDVDPSLRHIDQRKIRKLARDVDTVFAVESLMDWRAADWIRGERARSVVQGNPEFYIHRRFPGLSEPDVWVWPTYWMLDELPDGPVLPVPIPDNVPQTAAHPDDPTYRVLHVAGHAAAGDRNGTVDFMECLASLRRPVEVTVIGQDGWLPSSSPGPKVRLGLRPFGVENRWDLYRGQHLVVLPRKYGGLSLVAQEAMAAGCAVLMPDCPPNDTWPGPRVRARRGRLHNAPFGRIQTYNTDPRELANMIDNLEQHRDQLAKFQADARQWARVNTWSALTPAYVKVLG